MLLIVKPHFINLTSAEYYVISFGVSVKNYHLHHTDPLHCPESFQREEAPILV